MHAEEVRILCWALRDIGLASLKEEVDPSGYPFLVGCFFQVD
jgi:hypothetical protein